MRRRAAIWAIVGLVIAGFWAIYFFPHVNLLTSGRPILYALARITQPLVLVGSWFRVGVPVYWVLLTNAVIYGVAGVMAEIIRRRVFPPHLKKVSTSR